jgi:hypothetical protein
MASHGICSCFTCADFIATLVVDWTISDRRVQAIETRRARE